MMRKRRSSIGSPLAATPSIIRTIPMRSFLDLTESERAELANLYHAARIALHDKSDRHARLMWAAQQFHKVHPDTPTAAAYIGADNATRP